MQKLAQVFGATSVRVYDSLIKRRKPSQKPGTILQRVQSPLAQISSTTRAALQCFDRGYIELDRTNAAQLSCSKCSAKALDKVQRILVRRSLSCFASSLLLCGRAWAFGALNFGVTCFRRVLWLCADICPNRIYSGIKISSQRNELIEAVYIHVSARGSAKFKFASPQPHRTIKFIHSEPLLRPPIRGSARATALPRLLLLPLSLFSAAAPAAFRMHRRDIESGRE